MIFSGSRRDRQRRERTLLRPELFNAGHADENHAGVAFIKDGPHLFEVRGCSSAVGPLHRPG
jgi:hypothetical protein